MTYLVPDASAVVKWFVPEIVEAAADRWRAAGFDLLVPAHFRLEVAAALLKKVRSPDDGLIASEAAVVLREVERMPVEVRPIEPLLSHAFELAHLHRRSVHDSLYLALALSAGCQFMTADRKFYDAMVAAYPKTLRWVEDIPEA
ncbi:MAG TPA: type II toxin-antitoxin system VapC family toxin [Tepidiformaceae bacterium]|nr:type II toxin-antitoxin system VapC family toxin [Tepidiformaceae bacterium]